MAVYKAGCIEITRRNRTGVCSSMIEFTSSAATYGNALFTPFTLKSKSHTVRQHMAIYWPWEHLFISYPKDVNEMPMHITYTPVYPAGS
jgi:hypothetical protein